MQDRPLTDEQRSILRQCLWDLNLSTEEFLAIIEGRLVKTWTDRSFCVARLLESVNWFKLVEVVYPELICSLWTEEVKKR